VRQGEARLARRLGKALRTLGKSIAKDVAKRTAKAAAKYSKTIPEALGKAEEEDERDIAARVVDEADWAPVAEASATELSAVAQDGARRTLAVLGIEDDEAILEQTFTTAVDWARARAAELVGKSWDEDGNLVDNPDADMAITDSIREDIRDAVAQALEDGDSAAELGETIEGLAGFSEDRALLIARTEIIRAHGQGQLAAMRESGVVEQKAWTTANDDDVSEECEANEEQGAIDLEDDFESGDDAPPAHPNCRCALIAVIPESSASDSEDDDEEQAAE
jgi:SPP1 gp7 family putative phage head morphogenesis protein